MWDLFGEAPSNRTASWHPPPDVRGSFNILSSCIVTLGLCIWSAIHLNVPEHDLRPKRRKLDPRGWIKAQHLRKVGWLVLGLLAPEMVAFTAWVQRREAHRLTAYINETISDRCGATTSPQSNDDVELGSPRRSTNSNPQGNTRKNKWTHIHSFLAVQGGFAIDTSTLPEPEKYLPGTRERVTLNPRGIRYLAKFEPLLLPDISKESIEDKSKADALTKGIVCLQAAWFVIQCIYRLAAPGHTTSLLELNTFAHAVCALLIYGLWWDKPLNVDEPVAITHPRVHDLCAYLCFDSTFDGPRDSSWVTLPSRDTMREKAKQYSPVVDVRSNEAVSDTLRAGWVSELSDAALREQDLIRSEHIVGTLVKPRNGPLRYRTPLDRQRWNRASLYHMVAGEAPEQACYTVTDRQRNFPVDFNFIEAFKLSSVNPFTRKFRVSSDGPAVILGFILAGVMYGGLHLFAWDAPFPSYAQQLLWKISALTVTSFGPLFVIVIVVNKCGIALYDFSERCISDSTACTLCTFVSLIALGMIYQVYLLTIPVILYICARFYLVVECFISLAYLPDSAFKQPQWAAYFIHIQ